MALADGRAGTGWTPGMQSGMGGDQAAGVLSQVRVAGAKRAGTPLSEEQAAEYHEQLRSR